MENQTLIGVRFGKLVVVEDQGIIPYGKKGLFRRHYLCKCDCGKKVSKARNSLLSNYVKSCGGSCLKSDPEYYGGNYRHGMAGTPIYLGWQAMINRCTKPKHERYKDYGGRGITVCKRWLKFENFLEDMGNKNEKNNSIERIDNNGNYEPGNCKWIPKSLQVRNQRRTKLNINQAEFIRSIKDIPCKKVAEAYGVSIHTVYAIRANNCWI